MSKDPEYEAAEARAREYLKTHYPNDWDVARLDSLTHTFLKQDRERAPHDQIDVAYLDMARRWLRSWVLHTTPEYERAARDLAARWSEAYDDGQRDQREGLQRPEPAPHKTSGGDMRSDSCAGSAGAAAVGRGPNTPASLADREPGESAPARAALPPEPPRLAIGPHPDVMGQMPVIKRMTKEIGFVAEAGLNSSVVPAGECRCDCPPCDHGQHHGPTEKCGIEARPDATEDGSAADLQRELSALRVFLADVKEEIAYFRECESNDRAHGGPVNDGGATAWNEAADRLEHLVQGLARDQRGGTNDSGA